jgi:ribosomal protein S18 acetylase RimI-like enzyme
MTVNIRLLTSADRPALDNIAEGVFDNAVDGALAAEFLADPRHHICVAIEEGVIVGFASAVHYVHPDKPSELWINEVGVAPPFQRRRLAKAILQELRRHARALGCAEAWVLTDEDNAPARALYKSVGGHESPQLMVSFYLARPLVFPPWESEGGRLPANPTAAKDLGRSPPPVSR